MTAIDLEDAALPEAAYVAAILGTNPGRVKSDELRKHLAADHGTRTSGSVVAPPDPLAAIPAEHRERFAELSLKAAKGDKRADAELTKLEARMIAISTQILRRQAAAAEENRIADVVERQAVADARAAKEQLHAELLERREAALVEVEAKTKALAEVVTFALICDADLWSAAVQLSWAPETRTASRITDFVASALGREGAGLNAMPSVYGVLRAESLTAPK